MDHELNFANSLLYQFINLVLLVKLSKLNTMVKTIKQWAGLWRSGLPGHSWWLVSGGAKNATPNDLKQHVIDSE